MVKHQSFFQSASVRRTAAVNSHWWKCAARQRRYCFYLQSLSRLFQLLPYKPECGSSVTSCDVKKVLDMQIKTECDSCRTVTSCAEQQDISFALLCSKRVSGGQVVTFQPRCWCISYFLQGSESALHVGMEFKQYNHLKVPFQVTSILHRPPLSFLPCPVLSQLFYSKCAWELLHIQRCLNFSPPWIISPFYCPVLMYLLATLPDDYGPT